MAQKLSALLAELKRRKVYRVAGVYIAVGAGVIGLADAALPAEVWDQLQLPVSIAILLGFPVALVLAWAYEVRPETGGEVLETRSSAKKSPGDVSAETSGGSLDPKAVLGEDVRPTIAVLPFDDFSPNPDDAYFAGGIHEEILTQLQKVGGLAVRARTSVLRYRKDPKPVPEIARELGVQYILEGSARKAGDQVRLTAQLMDAVKDEHIWAENFDRPLTIQSLIAVQAEIAQQVTVELKGALSPSEEATPPDRPTDNLEAYEEYLRGKHLAQRYTKGGFEGGIEHFSRATELDGGFAEANVGLGYCYKEMAELSYMDPEEGRRAAQAAVTRALELDPDNGEAIALLASMQFAFETDRSRPEPLFQKALRLSPDAAEVSMLYGGYLMFLGRGEESIEVLRRAVELDPLKPMPNTWLACAYFYSHRNRESIRAHERLLELEPNWPWSHMYLSHNYSAIGDHEKAVEFANRVEEVGRSMGDDYLVTYVGGTYAWAGMEEKARTILGNAIQLYEKGSIDAVSVAVILAQLGEKEEAFKWLDRGVEDRTGLTNYLKIYGGTFMRDLEADPRFNEILQRVGFPA
ncbi:MAG: tetratricopeptide repeat protein [Gemmatimonadota bacterium]|jgi:TolB-like protein